MADRARQIGAAISVNLGALFLWFGIGAPMRRWGSNRSARQTLHLHLWAIPIGVALIVYAWTQRDRSKQS